MHIGMGDVGVGIFTVRTAQMQKHVFAAKPIIQILIGMDMEVESWHKSL